MACQILDIIFLDLRFESFVLVFVALVLGFGSLLLSRSNWARHTRIAWEPWRTTSLGPMGGVRHSSIVLKSLLFLTLFFFVFWSRWDSKMAPKTDQKPTKNTSQIDPDFNLTFSSRLWQIFEEFRHTAISKLWFSARRLCNFHGFRVFVLHVIWKRFSFDLSWNVRPVFDQKSTKSQRKKQTNKRIIL